MVGVIVAIAAGTATVCGTIYVVYKKLDARITLLTTAIQHNSLQLNGVRINQEGLSDDVRKLSDDVGKAIKTEIYNLAFMGIKTK